MPKLISLMLTTMSQDANDQVKAQPEFAKIINEVDVVGLWTILEKVFSRQVAYSVVALRTKLITMRQESSLFDSYVCDIC